LIRGYKLRAHRTNKKWNEGKGLIFFWYFLIACALMMWFCRIITVIHRPSDILGGIIIGTAIPLLLTWKPLFKHLKTYLITPLVKFQERIFSWFKHK
jgi:membrane-associated phospholipid phosphatase